jgi:hypothetical protein
MGHFVTFNRTVQRKAVRHAFLTPLSHHVYLAHSGHHAPKRTDTRCALMLGHGTREEVARCRAPGRTVIVADQLSRRSVAYGAVSCCG